VAQFSSAVDAQGNYLNTIRANPKAFEQIMNLTHLNLLEDAYNSRAPRERRRVTSAPRWLPRPALYQFDTLFANAAAPLGDQRWSLLIADRR
jgi:hypothetical protein